MLRAVALSIAIIIASLLLVSNSASAGTFFPETGFSITNDRIQDYFDHRGGVRVFGYPISRELYFMGTRVQFFQRAVLQVQSNGNVGLLNLLSDDLLPYTTINGSTFPAANPAVLALAPPANDPNFAVRAMDFLRAFAPDEWEGMKTNFHSTFLGTVTYQEAFPGGGVDPGLLPLVNLEIWGLPTSRPTYDPNNGNFIYLRFQRGIMHFDKTSGVTQGILLGDYLKSVITGQSLPLDLTQQAQSSKLYRQYNNALPGGLNRPFDLLGTNLWAAFEKDGVVVAAPAPATPVPPTPVATAVPVAAPPAATATPQALAQVAVVGEARFVEQINSALNLLAMKSPYNYNLVKQYVYRIEEDPGGPYAGAATNLAARSFKIPWWTAWAPEWESRPDNQREWLAGLLVHNAVHIAQHLRGSPTEGVTAEREAMVRQQDAFSAVETTTEPTHQFWDYVQSALDTGDPTWFGHWRQPQPPGWLKPTPTP